MLNTLETRRHPRDRFAVFVHVENLGYILQHLDVGQRVAVDDDQVGLLADLDGADLVLEAEHDGVVLGGADDGFHRRATGFVDVDVELHGALAVHWCADEIGAQSAEDPGLVDLPEALEVGLLGGLGLDDRAFDDPQVAAHGDDQIDDDEGGHQGGCRFLPSARCTRRP